MNSTKTGWDSSPALLVFSVIIRFRPSVPVPGHPLEAEQVGEECQDDEQRQVLRRVEPDQFATGGDRHRPADNDELAFRLAADPFQCRRQPDLLAGIDLLAETANGLEVLPCAIDETAGRQAKGSRNPVPEIHRQPCAATDGNIHVDVGAAAAARPAFEAPSVHAGNRVGDGSADAGELRQHVAGGADQRFRANQIYVSLHQRGSESLYFCVLT